jgi:hypothetical protein
VRVTKLGPQPRGGRNPGPSLWGRRSAPLRSREHILWRIRSCLLSEDCRNKRVTHADRKRRELCKRQYYWGHNCKSQRQGLQTTAATLTQTCETLTLQHTKLFFHFLIPGLFKDAFNCWDYSRRRKNCRYLKTMVKMKASADLNETPNWTNLFAHKLRHVLHNLCEFLSNAFSLLLLPLFLKNVILLRHPVQRRMIGRLINSELESMWTEAVTVWLKVLPWNWHGASTEVVNKIRQSR